MPPAKPSSEIFSAAWICQAVEGGSWFAVLSSLPTAHEEIGNSDAVEEAYKSTALAPMTPPAPERAESPELKCALRMSL